MAQAGTQGGKTMYLVIPVTPTGQQRPRFASRCGHGVAYKSKTQKAHESDLGFYIRQQRPEAPLEGPVEVTLDAHYPIPKSWPKWKRAAALSGEIRPAVKPDIDNVLKQALDCSNGILFDDDKQVVGVMCRKFYSADPRLELGVREAV